MIDKITVRQVLAIQNQVKYLGYNSRFATPSKFYRLEDATKDEASEIIKYLSEYRTANQQMKQVLSKDINKIFEGINPERN